MSKRVAVLLALTLVPSSAIACSDYPPNPKRIFDDHSNVVVAYPIGISNHPRAANNASYLESFRQTILWRVVVTWKGKYQPGDKFTTRNKLSRSGMCSPGAGLYTETPLILAFNGSEPYSAFNEYSVEIHPDIFKYFQKSMVKKGT